MLGTNTKHLSREELFSSVPVAEALFAMAIPTIISQMINLIYNMVDAWFIGRTGNSYMMAAASISLTLVLMNVALANLFGIGGGSLMARLMGAGKPERAKQVSAFSFYGAIGIALVYSALAGLFLTPILDFLGASDMTIGYARSYAMIVIVLGSLPILLSMALAHLLRNAGFSFQASMGLSMGGILNAFLDPLFMFVILPKGQEVTGAAIATTISNTVSALYLLMQYRKASAKAPLSMDLSRALKITPEDRKGVFSVGIPSAVLVGLFDAANICVNILAAAHNDFVLAAMGIVMKIERLPNAVNIGICQGMLPIVAYNYSAGSHQRMKDTINTARFAGLAVSLSCVLLLEIFARPAANFFLSTTAGDTETALRTIAYAAIFLRIRCIASPFQLLNYHSSYCLQAMGKGKQTLVHAFVRELVFYIPLMFLLDGMFGECGLAAALPCGEALGALFAIWLLHHAIPESANL
ncbi:MAG: hypothetical protein J6S26_02555 [Solobacterium sp.]|nr:hypothetical protein [Solobacterium sp.]